MSLDVVLTEELIRGRDADIIGAPDWSGRWWVRKYRGLFVVLVQYSGTRWSNATTGEEIRISIPRYWVLWWRTWWHRRRGSGLPKAQVRR